MRIGIYVGSEQDTTSQYIEKQLISWGQYLDEHQLDAFGSAPVPKAAAPYYESHHSEPKGYRTPYGKVMAVYRECIDYLANCTPDVLIQLRNYSTHGAGVALAGTRAGVPVVVRYTGDHFNDFHAVGPLQTLPTFLLHNVVGRIPIKLADQFIALGPYGESELRKRGASEERISILPPSPDVEGRFKPPDDKSAIKERLDLPTDRPVVLYVGKLIEQKGMSFFQRIINRASSMCDVQFVVIGQGPYQEEFRRRYDADIVRAEGYVDYQDIHRYYKAADVYIHPSKHEGIPLVILEALSCGVPVVARSAGDVEFVTGRVYESPEEMASAVLDSDLNAEWHNKEYFSRDYQKSTLKEIIDTI
ncbi:glycosyltransferase [Halorubrum sp. SS5]|nr:glycosyltransferase [Halorubrum sp. SS5]